MTSAELSLQSVDQFGKRFSMIIDKSTSVQQTTMGALCSLMMLIIVTAYFVQKCEVWYSKKDVDLLSATETGFFNSSYVFDHEQGLNFAVALTAYDN